MASVDAAVTEMYLWNVCSDQEILRRHGRGQELSARVSKSCPQAELKLVNGSTGWNTTHHPSWHAWPGYTTVELVASTADNCRGFQVSVLFGGRCD